MDKSIHTGDLVCFVPWQENPQPHNRGIVLQRNDGESYVVFWFNSAVRATSTSNYLLLISRASRE